MAVPGPYDHNLPEWQANDPAFLHLDVGGYNYQWQQYEIDHKRFPHRIMMGTESFPIEAYDSWRSAERLSYVLGDFVWTGHRLLRRVRDRALASFADPGMVAPTVSMVHFLLRRHRPGGPQEAAIVLSRCSLGAKPAGDGGAAPAAGGKNGRAG